MIWGIDNAKARSEVKTRLNPLFIILEGRRMVVRPITPKPAPMDMFPRLRVIASRKETFFTSPVL